MWSWGRLGAPDNVHGVVPRDKGYYLLTVSTYFSTLFENTQNKCYPTGLVALFSEPKSRCVSHQANACLLCGEGHPLPTMQKGAGTSTGGHLRPPLGVVLVLGLEAMISTWKELK